MFKKVICIYASIENCPKPWGGIRDTIDTDLFVPANLERFQYENIKERPLVIGWVGYSTIDIYVCVSLIEGTPRPALEALSCGVPIISTDVGVVKELLGTKQKQFILKERSVKELKQKIRKLYQERELFEELSEENRKEGIKNSSKNTVKLYEDFFTF